MGLKQALVEAFERSGWTVTQLAAAAGKTETTARRWIDPGNPIVPGGESLIALQRELPGFVDLLDIEGAA